MNEPPPQSTPPLLQIEDLKVHIPAKRSVLGGQDGLVKAVDGVSFHVNAGETLGLVGESGCGKTTLARAILRLINVTSGRIVLDGEDITQMRGANLRARRRKMQLIFQDSQGALDPRISAEESIGEALDVHGLAGSRAARQARIRELLQAVGLDPSYANRYPHEFSGGQRQRIGIARALAVEPKLIVCDEPVSALDVSVQAQIVNLLRDVQQQFGMAFLFIAHDLAVVEHLSSRVMVMYLGQMVESGATAQVIGAPAHPYTRALVSSVPAMEGQNQRITLKGDVPSPLDPPPGCRFHPRCPIAEMPLCRNSVPALRRLGPDRCAACFLAEPRRG